jgi:competence protein ComEC
VSTNVSGQPTKAPPAPPYCGGQEPVFLAALAFSAGILAADFFWRSPYVWLVGLAIAMAAAILSLRRSPQLAFACGILAIVPLGGLYLQARDAAQSAVVEDLQPFGTGDDGIDVTAHVIREGLIRDSPYGGQQESVDVVADQMRLDERVLTEPVGIRLTIYSKSSEEELARESGAESPLHVYRYGERLHLTAKLRLPHNYRNPGAMDMAGYLASQGIRMTG